MRRFMLSIFTMSGLFFCGAATAGVIEGPSFIVQPASNPFLSFVVDRVYYSTYFVNGHWQIPAAPLTDAGPIPGTAPVIATEGPSPVSVILDNGDIYRCVTGGWEYNGNLLSGITAVNAPATGSASLRAFPNPSEAVVTFDLGRERGAVDIFDANGRLLRNLTEASGMVRWDGKDDTGMRVPGGVYFWRATGGTANGRVVVTR